MYLLKISVGKLVAKQVLLPNAAQTISYFQIKLCLYFQIRMVFFVFIAEKNFAKLLIRNAFFINI